MSALPSPGPNPAFAAFAGPPGITGDARPTGTGRGRAGRAGGAERVQAEEQVLFEPE